MKLLLGPAAVWCVVTTCFAATEAVVLPPFPAWVAIAAAEAPPEKADRLAGIREHLGGLAEDLEETHKAVEEMARQRDQAREEAGQSMEARRLAMEEAATLRKQLAEAKREGGQWREKAGQLEAKAREAALAQEDLLKFRGELRGAIEEFQVMKAEIEGAREVLQDPVERAGLRQTAAQLTEQREQLGSEIEEALQSKRKGEEEAGRMRKELESKLRTVMNQLKEARERISEMAVVQAAREAAEADAEALRGEVRTIAEKNAALQLDLATQERALAAAQAEGAEAAGAMQQALQEAAKEAADGASERAAVLARLEALGAEETALRGELREAGERIKAMERDSGKTEQALKQSEEARRRADSQTGEAERAASALQEEMAVLKKAKTGLEELLFRKTDEVRELRKRVRELEEGAERKPHPVDRENAG